MVPRIAIYHQQFNLTSVIRLQAFKFAQSAGDVEYTDCFSAEG